jgi:hypothetical protein
MIGRSGDIPKTGEKLESRLENPPIPPHDDDVGSLSLSLSLSLSEMSLLVSEQKWKTKVSHVAFYEKDTDHPDASKYSYVK